MLLSRRNNPTEGMNCTPAQRIFERRNHNHRYTVQTSDSRHNSHKDQLLRWGAKQTRFYSKTSEGWNRYRKAKHSELYGSLETAVRNGSKRTYKNKPTWEQKMEQSYVETANTYAVVESYPTAPYQVSSRLKSRLCVNQPSQASFPVQPRLPTTVYQDWISPNR